jgi:sulfur-oxidizing protein SoxY
MHELDTKRRKLLKGVLAGGTIGALVGAGLLTPRQLLAAWPEAAFDSDSLDGVMQALFSSASPEASDRVSLKVPEIAENGAVVPIRVETDLENVESISIVVAENPSPLAATFEMTPHSIPNVSTRIKMGKTSQVLAVVKADGKLFSTQKEVKVTIGGCGG